MTTYSETSGATTKDWLKATEGMTFSSHDSAQQSGSLVHEVGRALNKKEFKQALRKVSKKQLRKK